MNDIYLKKTALKSHTEEEVRDAIASWQPVWLLDSVGGGEDDYLIGERAEVIQDLLHYLDAGQLPAGWELIPVSQPARLQRQ